MKEIVENFADCLKNNQMVFRCVYKGKFMDNENLFITFSLPAGYAKEWGSILLSFWLQNKQFKKINVSETTLKDMLPALHQASIYRIWASTQHPDCREITFDPIRGMVITVDQNIAFLDKTDKLSIELSSIFNGFIKNLAEFEEAIIMEKI